MLNLPMKNCPRCWLPVEYGLYTVSNCRWLCLVCLRLRGCSHFMWSTGKALVWCAKPGFHCSALVTGETVPQRLGDHCWNNWKNLHCLNLLACTGFFCFFIEGFFATLSAHPLRIIITFYCTLQNFWRPSKLLFLYFMKHLLKYSLSKLLCVLWFWFTIYNLQWYLMAYFGRLMLFVLQAK